MQQDTQISLAIQIITIIISSRSISINPNRIGQATKVNLKLKYLFKTTQRWPTFEWDLQFY